MISHQTIGMHLDGKSTVCFQKALEERLVIRGVVEYLLPAFATIHNVVEGILKLNSKGA